MLKSKQATAVSEKKEIILHIGLPKTATTHLQTTIFPKLKSLAYIGRPAGLNDSVASYLGVSFMHSAEGISDNHLLLSNPKTWHERQLISHEGITGVALPHIIRPHITLDDFSERLDSLYRQLSSVESTKFRIIMVLRKHDEWLASRYANLAKHRYMATQHDFEKFVDQTLKIDRILIQPSLLHYKKLYHNLTRILSPENICILSFSHLKTSPVQFFSKLLSFLEEQDQDQEKIYTLGQGKTHALATGDANTWRLRAYEQPYSRQTESLASRAQKRLLSILLSRAPRTEKTIKLTSELSASINAHYAESIAWLEKIESGFENE